MKYLDLVSPRHNAEYALIVFTRYPEPGKTKTRLIPALGEEGAAQLQRVMTENTLRQAISLSNRLPVTIEIHFSGATDMQMRTWLGEEHIYCEQASGDLGARLLSAFQQAFTSGKNRVVAVGIDCPQLDAEILRQAFKVLEMSAIAIGPAVDGGYYLIGLNQMIPELFQAIPWGTGDVFAKTVKIAQKLKLSLEQLPMLHDIDLPQDLENLTPPLDEFRHTQ